MSVQRGAARRIIDPKNPLTSALAETFGGFRKSRQPIKGVKARARADSVDPYGHGARTDIVSEQLCNDVLRYLAPTLKPYKGCTIIDINPGACLWSKKLHDFLKPKNHVLMEPEDSYVEPFIKPLLEQPGSTFRHSSLSGTIFGTYLSNYRSLLDDSGLLPELSKLENDDPKLRQIRPSLLITGNMARKEATKLQLSRNISPSHGVIQHHVWTSLSNEILHRGGLARMLWWIPDHEKSGMLPQRSQYVSGYSIGLGFGGQVTEVAGIEPGFHYYRKNNLREGGVTINERSDGISLENARQVRTRMNSVGMKPLRSRAQLQPRNLREPSKDMVSPLKVRYDSPESLAKAIGDLETRSQDILAAVKQSRSVNRPEKLFDILDHHLRRIEHPQSLWQPRDEREVNRGRTGRHLAGSTRGQYDMSHGALYGSEMRAALILDMFLCIVNLETHYCIMKENGQDVDALKDRLIRLDEAARAKHQQDNPNLVQPIELMLDDNLAFYATPQILPYDRRPYEALQAQREEFWPKADMALLDIVPHTRDMAVPDIATRLEATRAAQDLLKYLFMFRSATLPWALDRMAPNAAQDLLPMVAAVNDPRKGGRLNPNNVRIRVLSDEMLEGLVKAWFEWPFKPETWQLALAAGGGQSSEASGSSEEEDVMTPEAVMDA